MCCSSHIRLRSVEPSRVRDRNLAGRTNSAHSWRFDVDMAWNKGENHKGHPQLHIRLPYDLAQCLLRGCARVGSPSIRVVSHFRAGGKTAAKWLARSFAAMQ
jgi:hypothetical protein